MKYEFVYEAKSGKVRGIAIKKRNDPPLRLNQKEIDAGLRVWTANTQSGVSLKTRILKFDEVNAVKMPKKMEGSDTKAIKANISSYVISQKTDVNTIIFKRTKPHSSIGDLVSITSAIQIARKELPNARIIASAPYPAITILENHPALDKVSCEDEEIEIDENAITIDLSHPCPCGEYENQKRADVDKSRNEIFTIASGFRWSNERPKLFVTEAESKCGYEIINSHEIRAENLDKGKPKIGIVLRSAEIWKDWPHTIEFIEVLKDQAIIYAIDKTKRVEGIHNLVDLTLRELMSALCYLDIVITPDTGVMHLCDALNVPCIALFGSMKVSLHEEKYDSSVSFIQGDCVFDHGPCMYDVCEGRGNYQPCMENIGVNRVIDELKKKGIYLNGLPT